MSLKAPWKPTWAAPTLGSVSGFCTRAPSSEREITWAEYSGWSIPTYGTVHYYQRDDSASSHSYSWILKNTFPLADFLVCASSPWLGKTAETEAAFKLAAKIVSWFNDRYSHKTKYEKWITCRSECPVFSNHKICDGLLCKYNPWF